MSAQLPSLAFELPSWAFRSAFGAGGDAGRGAPRSAFELLADAGAVHTFTGITPHLGLYLPDDKPTDGAGQGLETSDISYYVALAKAAARVGIGIGSLYPRINSDRSRPPAVCSADAWVRRRGVATLCRTAELVGELGASRLVLRFTDNLPYPGHSEFRARVERVCEAASAVCAQLPPGTQLSIEYPVDEPRSPSTRVLRELCASDYRINVLIDPQRDEWAQDSIVELAREGHLGGIVLGGLPDDPFGLFLTLVDMVRADVLGADILVMLDPSAWLQGRPDGGIPGMIEFVCAVQEYVVRAHALDRHAIASEDCVRAGGAIAEGYRASVDVGTDLGKRLLASRAELGVRPDPLAAFDEACRARYVATEREVALAQADPAGA